MDIYSGHINKLIEQLSRLPGVGAKSAQRLAFHIINMPEGEVKLLCDSISSAKENIRYCRECFTLTDTDLCPVCANAKRDHETIMVVENPRDMAAYEKTGKYEGVYHVLHGAISPMLGIGPNDLKIKHSLAVVCHDIPLHSLNHNYPFFHDYLKLSLIISSNAITDLFGHQAHVRV